MTPGVKRCDRQPSQADRAPKHLLRATLLWAQDFLEVLDCPRALTASLLIKYEEFDQLVSLECPPSDYLTAESYFLAAQATCVLSKFNDLPTTFNREQRAMEKFLSAEDRCREVNHRFRMRESGNLFDPDVERVLSRASRKISTILGDVPSLEAMDFRFGPGANFGVRGDTSVFKKVTSLPECTYAFADQLSDFLSEFPGWFPAGELTEVSLVPGGQLTFVPKTAKIDRVILIEPLLNGLYQKGVGSYVRARLRKHGIDLNDQSTNQRLARIGVRDGLATVDFSSASDSIAYNLVLDLLPWEWFEFLDVGRSPRYLLDGRWSNLQKFSSMGNAYTFELETLIFYAIAQACCVESGIDSRVGENLSVYGDDVILPCDAAPLFLRVAKEVGFTPNRDKTFLEGSFRESCGEDYFEGFYVRPFYLKRPLDRGLGGVYVHNSLKRLSRHLYMAAEQPKSLSICRLLRYDGRPSPHGEGSRIRHRRLGRLVEKLANWHVEPRYRVFGPDGYGDGHLIAPLDRAMSSRSSRVTRHPSFDAWVITTFVEQPSQVDLDEVPMSLALYTALSAGSVPDRVRPVGAPNKSASYPVRGKTRVARSRTLVHNEWSEGGVLVY